jgi:hypothetical protein
MKNKLNKEFYISLEGIEISNEQLNRIEKGIQELVIKELSKLKTIPDNSILLTKFPNFKNIGITMGMWLPPKESIIRFK